MNVDQVQVTGLGDCAVQPANKLPAVRRPSFDSCRSSPGAGRLSFFFSLWLLVLALSTGCTPSRVPTSPAAGIDLLDRFRPTFQVSREAGREPGFSARFPLTRGGVRRSGLLLVAPAALTVPLEGLRGRFEFSCVAAPVYNVGDGTVLEVVLAVGVERRTLLKRQFDAGRRAGDRQWALLSMPIDIARDRAVSLEVRALGGSANDFTGDWLVLSEPRLKPEASVR